MFRPHIDLAHQRWKECVQPGDIVLDATCGNGYDTLFLAGLALNAPMGTLFALDIQPKAIKNTREMLLKKLPAIVLEKIRFFCQCHSAFPQEIVPGSVKLIVYNLGYLPGENKEKKTEAETTAKSLERAIELLMDGGLISVTIYPRHPKGEEERERVIGIAAALSPQQWDVCHYTWVNRPLSPELLLITKRSSRSKRGRHPDQ